MTDQSSSPLGEDVPPSELTSSNDRPSWETERRDDLAPWETDDRSKRGANGQFLPGNPGKAKGTPYKNTAAARRMAAEIAGIEPLQFMLKGLGYIHSRIVMEEQSEKPSARRLERLYDRGMSYARDAAPYCHPKFASITHTAQLEGPPIDIRSLDDQQLDVLILRLQRGSRPAAVDSTVIEGSAEKPGSDEPGAVSE